LVTSPRTYDLSAERIDRILGEAKDRARARLQARDATPEQIAAHDPLSRLAPVGYRFRWADHVDPDSGDRSWMVGECVIIEPCINPVFDAALQAGGVVRTGSRSWSVKITENADVEPLRALLRTVDGSMCHLAGRNLEKTMYRGDQQSRAEPIIQALLASPLAARHEITRGELSSVLTYATRPATGPANYGNLLWTVSDSSLRLRAATHMNSRDGHFVSTDPIDLHLWKSGSDKQSVRVRIDEALRVHLALVRDTYLDEHVYIDDQIDIDAVTHTLDRMLIMYRMADAPGRAQLVVGPGLARVPDQILIDRMPGEIATVSVDAIKAGTLLDRARSYGIEAVMDDHTAVVCAMAIAPPAPDPDKILRPYQREGVGVHLATKIGYLNACAVGLGKTVMTLKAWQLRVGRLGAKDRAGWQAIVVGPASIRSQWVRETRRFFPEAAVTTLDSAHFARKLAEFEELNADRPRVLVLSYDAMRTCLDQLVDRRWNEMALDEITILSNPSSQRSKALWKLRPCCDTAVGLTGSVIEKNLDDLGHALSWVRNDPAMFRGRRKLDRAYDMSRPGDGVRLHRDLGPLLFRRDQSEIKDELPPTVSEIVILDPVPQEAALAQAARRGLQEIIARLDERLIQLESDPDADREMMKAARSELASLQMTAISGVTLARMAASDPEAVAASSSAAKLLLDGMGLVEPAVAKGGTKRKRICELVTDLAMRKDAVLVFTEFDVCAKHLASDLTAAGVRVGLFTGKVSHDRRDRAVLDFQAGELDVMIMTRTAREGLNLQRANVIVNYDLPWVPSWIVQRIGRARRIGSTAEKIMILTVIMAGTIEERVAAVLLPRAAMILAALDAPRGTRIEDTEIALAVAGLEHVNTEDETEKRKQLDYARKIFSDANLTPAA
jgi:superfamily II DNA or RNA helicase